jgi:putative membrane protein
LTVDAVLAITHHLAAFGLLGTLAAEWALVQPGLAATSVRRLARIDRGYGLLAAAVLSAGLARLMFGATDSAFLAGNIFFWTKMGAFGAVGLLSIQPTRAYLRWARFADDPSWQPPIEEVRSARRAIGWQLLLFPLIPTSAALMARGIGL